MNKTKKLISLLLVICLVLSMGVLLSACNDSTDDTGNTANEIAVGELVKNADGTITFRDMNNILHENMETGKEDIINLWPANTSTFFGIGAGDKLLATSINTTPWVSFFYPEISTRENFVIQGGTSASAESLLARNPDLVIVHPSNGQALQAQLLEAGVDAIYINFSNFEEMKQAYKIVGALLGGTYETKLNLWCDELDYTISRISLKTSTLTAAQKPSVLYCTAVSPNTDGNATSFTTMAGNSIFQQWCEIAGGTYYTAEHSANLTANAFTAEYVVSNLPDIILCAGANQNTTYNCLTGTDATFSVADVDYYKNPYILFDIARFGFEVVLQLRQAVSVIQPTIAAELGIDMDNEIRSFYSTYAGITLTDTQIDYIRAGKNPSGVEF